MKRKKDTNVVWRHVWTWMAVVVGLALRTADGLIQTQMEGIRRRTSGGFNPGPLADPPSHLAVEETLDTISSLRRLLSTNVTTAAPSEDKSFWEEVSDFYSDSNNMAMYCVLPILVLVYGGCSAIYCVHKCRRYIRRRRHKRRHADTEGLVAEEERNDLNQEGGDTLSGSDRQPIKIVSSNNWDDANASFGDVSGYNVQRKKTPLPWNSPQEIQRNDSFMAEKDNRASRETNYSTGSRESSSNVLLEREREKLDNKMEDSSHPPPPPQFRREQSRVGITGAQEDGDGEERRSSSNNNSAQPPPPPPPRPPTTTITRINEANPHHNPNNPRPIQIVPISRKEYEERMETGGGWDPLHNRPFASRAGDGGGGGGGAESERRSGRESAWSIRDEIMAKYDALTSLAMAKKTADVLRHNTDNPNLDQGGGGGGHYPDTARRKPGGGKKKLIFIAE